jgi:hypothetical protein
MCDAKRSDCVFALTCSSVLRRSSASGTRYDPIRLPPERGKPMKQTIAVCTLALAACMPAAAQEHYRLQNAAELARLCSTPASAKDHVTAIAFCHGVLAGSYGYFQASTPAADRFVCPPTPSVTRTQVANGFVAWLKARPQYNNDGAIDALFRFAAEAYPCKR